MTNTAGDTWGISGPTFLLLYPLLGFALMWVLSRVLTPYRHGSTTWMGTKRSLTPVEWGMLSRDDGAITAALAELLADGWIQMYGDRIVATRQGSGTLPTPMHGAVLLAVRERDGRVTMDEIRQNPAVQRELVTLRGLLEGRGLIATRRQQRGWILFYAGLVAWFALGAVRLVVGLERGRPVGYLVAELIALAESIALPKQVYGSVASDGSGGGDSGGSGSSCGGGCGGGCGG